MELRFDIIYSLIVEFLFWLYLSVGCSNLAMLWQCIHFLRKKTIKSFTSSYIVTSSVKFLTLTCESSEVVTFLKAWLRKLF